MSKQRQLGDILLESGRITRDEVDRTLAHQRTHGGYFGEAAVSLGLLSREEIDWALASQLDLPFIFPMADAVDRDAAMLVPPDWALAHLAVPIVRTRDAITVAVADPLATEVVAELKQRTGLEVEMALASAARIRELIRTLYGDSGSVVDDAGPPVQLADLVARALAQGADAIGVSDRGSGSVGWFTSTGATHRQPLEAGWESTLAGVLDPAPFEGDWESQGPVSEYQGTLAHRGAYVTVDVQVMSSVGGREILVRPTNLAANRSGGAAVPPSVAADLRMIARSGNARVGLAGDGPLDDLLPKLPNLVLGARARTVHVVAAANAGDSPATIMTGVYTIAADAAGPDLVERIRAFRFDALTTDLQPTDYRLAGLLDAAPITFVREPSCGGGDIEQAPGEPDLNWRLTVSKDDGALLWDLSPTNW